MKTKNNITHPQLVEIPQPLEVHPSVSPKAAALLEGVIEILMRTPEKYNQDNGDNTCGSPCCIIGHMRAISGTSYAYYGELLVLNAIGLTRKQAQSIFRACEWPTPCSSSTTPHEGIARIEHFLRTGE